MGVRSAPFQPAKHSQSVLFMKINHKQKGSQNSQPLTGTGAVPQKKHWLYALFVSLFLLLLPQQVWALDLNDVDNKTDEELAEENWETREVNASSGTMKCGFLSILVSTVWRGYGHYCNGDTESNKKFLIIEGVSLGMLASSLLISSLSNDDKALSATWKTLFHLGTTAFIGSYFADVLGTFKGDSFNLAENHLDPYGNSIDFSIRWIPSDDFNLGLQLEYTYRNPRFWINPYGYLTVIDLSDYQFGLDTGFALWYAEHQRTYVAIAIDSTFRHERANDYKLLKFIPYIELSLDFGSWFDHLANLRFINRIGFGTTLYSFASSRKPFSDTDLLLVLESGMSLNVLQDLNIDLIYRYRNDYVVGMISAPSRIMQTVPVPGVGIFSLDFSFNLSNNWRVAAEANFGNSVDFWLTIHKHF